jgi:hypothetical protein
MFVVKKLTKCIILLVKKPLQKCFYASFAIRLIVVFYLMKKITTTVALLLIFCFVVVSLIVFFNAEHAEPSWVMWSQTYGGTREEGMAGLHDVHLVRTSDGGFALAGGTFSFGAGGVDFWLVKTDANGNMEWNKTYGGADHDIPHSLIQTADEGFALAGETRLNLALPDFWLVKTDADGNMEWNKTYREVDIDSAKSVVQTSDGGYAIAGNTRSFGARLVKTNAYGDMEWSKTYGGKLQDGFNSLVATSDGGYAIAGNTRSFGAGLINFWLVKTDNLGNMEWNQTYGISDRNFLSSLIEVSDGGFAMAGDIHSHDAGGENFWLVKTDEDGDMEWNMIYGGADVDTAFSLVETSDGGYALAGETKSSPAGDFDFWLVKTDVSGNMEWNRTYGGANYDFANSVVQTSDGGYAIAGNTLSFGAGDYDFWLIKTNEQGVPEFPSWIILPLLIMATLTIILIKKRMYILY